MTAFTRVFAPLLLAYAVTFGWVWDRWWYGDYYSHGPLIPLVALAIVWMTRDRWSGLPAGADTRAWWLLGPGLVVHLAGAALMIDSFSAASLALTLPGAVWLALGAARLRAFAPVLGLMLLAMPLPIFVTGRVVFELKEFAIGSALGLVDLLGVEAERIGASIHIPGQSVPLLVADPCSGLRSLLALITLGYCIAFFFGPARGMRPWVLLLASIPLAILANVLRIAAICWAAGVWGTQAASTTGHFWFNIAQWVFDLGALMAIDYCFFLRRHRGSR